MKPPPEYKRSPCLPLPLQAHLRFSKPQQLAMVPLFAGNDPEPLGVAGMRAPLAATMISLVPREVLNGGLMAVAQHVVQQGYVRGDPQELFASISRALRGQQCQLAFAPRSSDSALQLVSMELRADPCTQRLISSAAPAQLPPAAWLAALKEELTAEKCKAVATGEEQ